MVMMMVLVVILAEKRLMADIKGGGEVVECNAKEVLFPSTPITTSSTAFTTTISPGLESLLGLIQRLVTLHLIQMSKQSHDLGEAMSLKHIEVFKGLHLKSKGGIHH